MLPTLSGRRPSSNAPVSPNTTKFPDFSPPYDDATGSSAREDERRNSNPHAHTNGHPIASHARLPFKRQDTWRALKDKTWQAVVRPNRQKSLGEAIRSSRERKASITESAHEIAESLKAPVSLRLVLLCLAWFAASIVSNASSKAILTALPRPVTLTIAQFAQTAAWCLFSSWVAKHNPGLRNAMPILRNGIRRPSREIVMATLPLTAFQITGHILNSDAMSRIPVALVHTIKGLSPLMTVFAYRSWFDYQYSRATYLSLIPLTLGVFMSCSASFQANFLGLLYAFGSTAVFVAQNIVSKKLFTEAAKSEAEGLPINRQKPDKLNLLCYSTSLALLFTFPLWLWSEAFPMLAEYWDEGAIELRKRPGSLDHGALAVEFFFNGFFHFGQALIAFTLLGLVSPVSYSVASLIKRVAVILFAIVWFGNPMTTIQAFGFALTFIGLYLYDRTADADKVDRRERAKREAARPLLPTSTTNPNKPVEPLAMPLPASGEVPRPFVGSSGYMNGDPAGSGPGRPWSTTPLSPTANGVPVAPTLAEKADER